jgi:hypothetical protein
MNAFKACPERHYRPMMAFQGLAFRIAHQQQTATQNRNNSLFLAPLALHASNVF